MDMSQGSEDQDNVKGEVLTWCPMTSSVTAQWDGGKTEHVLDFMQ